MSAGFLRKDSMAARRSLKRSEVSDKPDILDTNRLERCRADEVWLATQRHAYDEDLAEFLTTVLKEWIVRNPGRSLGDTDVASILPEALDEFIWKHLSDC
jgi:hypothetical protein